MASSSVVHDSTPARNHHPNSSEIGLGLDIADIILTGLSTAAKTSKIPYLQYAAQQALDIVTIIKDVRSNKDAFKQLGKDACEVVHAILLAVDKSGPTSEALLKNLQELLGKMTEIEKFVKKKAKRNMVIWTIKHKSDLDTIHKYRGHLRQSKDLFELKSSITILGNISLIQDKLDEIIEHGKLREEAEKAKADKTAASARKEAEEKEKMEKERLMREEEEAKRKRYGEEAAGEQELKRLEKERKERESLAYSISEQERLEEKRRLEEQKLKESKEERIREEKEKLERKREWLAQERKELERLEWLKPTKDREEKEKAEKERLERLRWEEEERYRAEKERAERARQKEERTARTARYPNPPTPPFLQSPFPTPHYPPVFGHVFPNLNLNHSGVYDSFVNTGVFQNNVGNTTQNNTTNSNNDSSFSYVRSPKKKKKKKPE